MEITLGERQVSADRPFPCSSSSGALVADPPEDLIRRLQDTQGRAKFVGQAPAFVKAVSLLRVVARSEGVVLISGETGTGKELVASAIRYLGERGGFPFVPVKVAEYLDRV